MRSQHRQSARDGSVDRSFRRAYRIRKRGEFLRIQRGHRGKKTPHFIVIRAPGSTSETRLGVTVSRRVGGAVARNRIKRRVREFFRLYRSKLQPAYDVVIIARAGAEKLSFQDVASELAAAFHVVAD